MAHLTDGAIDTAALLEETRDRRCGALVVFEGVVRDHHAGEGVIAMTYTAYAPLAERTLAELEDATRSRFRVEQCRVVHRLGYLEIGEASVVVVVRAAHRQDAYAASRHVIDTLKQTVPIWKQDHLADGGSRYQDGTPLRRGSER